MPKKDKFTLPTVFVIFGITGDLVRSKILISLYRLYTKNLLPKMFQIVGVSRRAWDDEDLRLYLKKIINTHYQEDQVDEFLKHFFYVEGNFDDEASYQKLGNVLGRVDGEWKVCSNKLFYLAVPPQSYKSILLNLSKSGLTIPCGPEEGWTRVILEKPFGSNLKTAQELDMLLAQLFKEEQIYRVDHYLGKETVRNILAFRFANSFLFPAWNNQSIEKINIIFKEKDTVSGRGAFYDGVGALRDFGQNHVLQVLALFMMDNPVTLTTDAIRQKRVELLSKIHSMSQSEIETYTAHGQYEGYTKETGVKPDSMTETYFKMRISIDDQEWNGVPVTLEYGKALDHEEMYVQVIFKDVSAILPMKNGQVCQNVLTYYIQPEEKIVVSFLVKKPGHDSILEEKKFEFDYQKEYPKKEFVDAYEKLILDMVKGDQTLFVSTDEIVAEWKFVEPILSEWAKNTPPLFTYKQFEPLSVEFKDHSMEKQIAIVGLGKMGGGIAQNLLLKNWKVVGYNRSYDKTAPLMDYGLVPSKSIKEAVQNLSKTPRIVLLSLTAGAPIDEALFGVDGLIHYLKKGDIIIDAGNSYYKDTIKRAQMLFKNGIHFVDVGTSGGPGGALAGASLMVGGHKEIYDYLFPLFSDMSIKGGVAFFEGHGAGHFVKMVHNAIEYGMMQAIGEGFEVMKKSAFNLDLKEVSRIYNNGSVVESRLIDWLYQAFERFGNELSSISGSVNFTGEGEWTVKAAKEEKVAVKVIEESFLFRQDSQIKPTYTGQVVSALRHMFGGHDVFKK